MEKSTVPFQIFFTEHPANGAKSKNMNMGKDDKGGFQPIEEFFVVHRGNNFIFVLSFINSSI